MVALRTSLNMNLFTPWIKHAPGKVTAEGGEETLPFPSIQVLGTYSQESLWEMTGDDGPQTGGANRRFSHHWKYGTNVTYVCGTGVVIRKGTGGVDAHAGSTAVAAFRTSVTSTPNLGFFEESPSIGLFVVGGPSDFYLSPGESFLIEVYTSETYFPPAAASTQSGYQSVLIKYGDLQYA